MTLVATRNDIIFSRFFWVFFSLHGPDIRIVMLGSRSMSVYVSGSSINEKWRKKVLFEFLRFSPEFLHVILIFIYVQTLNTGCSTGTIKNYSSGKKKNATFYMLSFGA